MEITAEIRAAVVDVVYRYATGIDQRQWPLFRTCWTDDCDVEYEDVGTWTGGDEVTAFMERIHARCGASIHRITNPVVWSEGDRIRARSHVDAVVSLPEDQAMRAIGTYDDEFVSTSDGWRIARRQFSKLHLRIGPFAEVV